MGVIIVGTFSWMDESIVVVVELRIFWPTSPYDVRVCLEHSEGIVHGIV